MAISLVGSSQYSETTNDSSYTINKPSGVASGDFLVAIVAVDTFASSGGDVAINAPSGWTKVSHKFASPNHVLGILTRTAGSSEPGSWNGTLGGNDTQKIVLCAAYRGTSGLAVEGPSKSVGGNTSLTSSTVNNPSANNWRVICGSYSAGSTSYSLSSNEVSERRNIGIGTGNLEAGLWDSNGTIATGNTSRNISRGGTWESAAIWIGILSATSTTIPGTFSATISLPVVSAVMSQSYSGTLAGTLPKPTMTASGIATPPEGSLSVSILPTVSISGVSDVTGSLSVNLLPIVDLQAETRQFGIRVTTVEAENRTIVPRLGAS